MAPPLLAIAIPAAISFISSLVQQGNNAEAQEEIERLVGQYGPEARALIEKELGGPGAMAQVYGERLAPEAASAQREALRRMQQVAAGGYTPEEEAALRNIQSQTAAMASSQQAALQGQLQRQGVLDSGARIAMQQAAGQAAANRAGQQGLETAAQAQRRAFQAMQGLGSLGTSVRAGTFEEARARAAAEEARQLNRARMGMDVSGDELRAKTGTLREGAKISNAPWEQASQAAGVIGKGWAAYEGAPEDKKEGK
jgi:hypothetical protein